jgi:nucleotide-binding universal stress UspA family protein
MTDETTLPFIRSVVHATDFSPESERAFAHALAIALIRRASLTLIHVGSDSHGDWGRFPAVRKTLERWNLLSPGSAQEDVFAAVGVRVTKVALPGRFPALAVADYLETHPADLLVVTTEGREGVSRWLRGSVAEAMARWSKTMTLFVPVDTKRTIVAEADGTLTLDNVLIPVDRAPDPGAAIEFARRAAEVAGDGNVTITLLHVGGAYDVPGVPARDGDGWRLTWETRTGDPVDEIVKAADSLRAHLIVMPTEGRHGVFDALRGSTTERVLRRATCPVLAVPSRTSA